MRPILLAVHIAGGSVGLLSGFVALSAAKGGALHRRGGMVFVYAMLTMCVAGALLAVSGAGGWAVVNSSAAVLTGYLVLTSLAAVRSLDGWTRRLDVGLMLVASAVCAVTLPLGIEAAAAGGRWRGVPAFPFFMFGVVGLLAVAGDLRLLRSGAPRGAARVARHLWRMTFALFVASMSFFLGQAKVIPKPIRILPLLAVPPLVVLAALVYWMWRVRVRRSLRSMVVVGATRTA